MTMFPPTYTFGASLPHTTLPGLGRIRMTVEHAGMSVTIDTAGETAGDFLEVARACAMALGFQQQSWEDAVLDEAELARKQDRERDAELAREADQEQDRCWCGCCKKS